MTISIPIVATLPANTKAELEELVEEFATLAFPSGKTYLRQVEVLPAASIAPRANQLLALSKIPNLAYSPPVGRATPISVPIETCAGLDCYVIIPEEVLLDYPVRSPSNATSLLEEMLHADLYGRLWQQRGYFQPTAAQVPVHLVDLTVIATKLIDEYITNRRKAKYIGTMPIVESNGVRQQGVIMTPPGELIAELRRSRLELRDISRHYSEGQPANAAGYQLTTWVWRSVFEPLAYDAGKRGWWEPVEETANEAAAVPFFATDIRSHWERVLTHLERARTSDLSAFTSAADSIVVEICAFFAHLGVDLQTDGSFVFHSSFNRWRICT